MPRPLLFVNQTLATVTRQTVPLFPLNTVLFPDGPLPLRIFEPRYLDMVSRCLKTNTGIGICLIEDGAEVGAAAKTYDIGTLSNITYWHRRPDGLLGITVRGVERFRIVSRSVERSQLILAEVETIPNEPSVPLPHQFQPLADLLHSIIHQLDAPYTTMPMRFDEASWVGGRLVELLPLRLSQKQYFLQLEDPLERLDRLRAVLDDMDLWADD